MEEQKLSHFSCLTQWTVHGKVFSQISFHSQIVIHVDLRTISSFGILGFFYLGTTKTLP